MTKHLQLQSLIVLLLLAIGFSFGFLLPHRQAVTDLEARIDQADRKAQAHTTRLAAALPQATAAVRQLEGMLSDTTRYLPTQNEWAGFHHQLTRMFEEHRVDNADLTTRAVVSGEKLNMLPATITLDCGFPSFFALLREMEANPRLMQFTHISLQTRRDLPGPVQARIELATFFGEQGGP